MLWQGVEHYPQPYRACGAAPVHLETALRGLLNDLPEVRNIEVERMLDRWALQASNH